jgi:hypothetical protein
MKLYVPEIGDHIRLTEDWTFRLHAENRNVTLANMFGYIQFGWNGAWLDTTKIEPAPERDYHIDYPNQRDFVKMFGSVDWESYRKAQEDAEDNSPSYQAYLKAYDDWKTRAEAIAIENLDITLPKGTVLAVDRIYIRKGASDYSSITFYAKGLGESEIKNRWSNRVTKWKAQRFWAKLSDCNQIEFELMEEKEVLSTFKVTKQSKK